MKTTELMKKIRYVKYALGFVLICTVLFTINSCLRAHAKTTTYKAVSYPTDPSDFNFFPKTAYKVPHDVPTAADSTQTALSIFAWQEFIALNWPSSYDTKNYERGKPDTSKTVKDFLNGTNTGELVWHTYKHRVEVYPKLKFKTKQEAEKYDISFERSFDAAPKYQYAQTINPLNPNSNKSLNEVTVFNNLDEASEINLCTLFVNPDPNEPGADPKNADKIASGLPGAPRRMIYEAKVNRAMFEYVVSTSLQDTLKRAARIKFTDNAIKNEGRGAVYLTKEQQKQNPKQIVFPFGEIGGSEGSIEIKATWRQLTLNEFNSKRFLTAPIIRYRGGTIENPNKYGDARYEVVEGTPQYDKEGNLTSLPYGLVGLHIIHKTKTFPSYVFATFEQVDNLSDGYNPVTMKRDTLNDLFYYNRQRNPSIHSKKRYNVYTRANAIKEDTKKVNDAVHTQIKNIDSGSVWQYYKLIGVQGHPAQNDNNTDYYLANITTETNDILANFSGTLDTLRGTKDPNGINVYQGKNKIVQGGCKGCHGNAQNSDFSFITKDAPIKAVDFINQPLLKRDSIQ